MAKARASITNIVITGASSGIGAALAAFYARPGVTLGLTGRDPARLAACAAEARAKGAVVEEGVFDVRDRDALGGFLTSFDASFPIDLLVANAGVLDGRRADGAMENADAARRVVEINLLGAMDTVAAVLPEMRQRGRGHIVLVSSLAALSPVPDAPAYSASKAGMLGYGRALRAAVAGEGVQVSVVCPGYVTSAMTETHIGNQPGKISAAAAARLIDAGIAANRAVIGFPAGLYVSSMLTLFLPEALVRAATRKIRFYVSPNESPG